MATGLTTAIYQVNQDFAELDVQLFAFLYSVASVNTNDGDRVV